MGTTMVTIDIATASDLIADTCSPETATKLAGLMEHDPGVIRMVRALAYASAVRTAGYSLTAAHMDLRFCTAGTKILIDIDTETERKAA